MPARVLLLDQLDLPEAYHERCEHRFGPEPAYERGIRDRAHQGLAEAGEELALHIQVLQRAAPGVEVSREQLH